jgi:hypothetical protein
VGHPGPSTAMHRKGIMPPPERQSG